MSCKGCDLNIPTKKVWQIPLKNKKDQSTGYMLVKEGSALYNKFMDEFGELPSSAKVISNG